MISNATNHYLPRLQFTATQHFTNKKLLSGSMFVRGKIDGSKAVTALGWYGKKAMNNYWSDLSYDLHAGVPTKKKMNQICMAMLWGSINDDSALVTYLNDFFSQKYR